MNEFSCLHGNERYGACDDASTVITSIGFFTQKSKQIRKNWRAIMVTPVSCPFELVIAA